jgi:hypothetical protein
MKKLLQLIFGDLRNVASVAVALLAAYGVSRLAPAAAGAALALLLIAAAALQAIHAEQRYDSPVEHSSSPGSSTHR